jgi:HPt (histidine-containing phosphotransfer) domain-containing protein
MSTPMRAFASPSEPSPAAEGPAIDLPHLERMTLGERSLQREVLALFERQAELLLPRLRCGDRAAVAMLAHTLKGSARGIGAWRVAAAAEAVEQAAETERLAAIDALAAAVAEIKAEIAGLLAVR